MQTYLSFSGFIWITRFLAFTPISVLMSGFVWMPAVPPAEWLYSKKDNLLKTPMILRWTKAEEIVKMKHLAKKSQRGVRSGLLAWHNKQRPMVPRRIPSYAPRLEQIKMFVWPNLRYDYCTLRERAGRTSKLILDGFWTVQGVGNEPKFDSRRVDYHPRQVRDQKRGNSCNQHWLWSYGYLVNEREVRAWVMIQR